MSTTRLLQSPALRRAVGRGFITVLLIIAIVGAFGGVALSPAVIGHVSNTSDAQWQRLSNIGQTYGAASAMLSVLALIGVAISLILQSRETRAAREQARRALHFELLKMAMDQGLCKVEI
jgi:ABC-type sulfate transport system permease subunit